MQLQRQIGVHNNNFLPVYLTMKATFRTLTIAMLLILGIASFAQVQTDRFAQRAKKQTENLTQKLSLNEDQAKKVETILFNFYVKMEADMQEQSDSENPTPNPLLVEKRNLDLKQVLTPEQYKAFVEMNPAKNDSRPNRQQGEQRERGQGRGHGQGRGNHNNL